MAMEKLSNAEVGQLNKLAAQTIRALSGENQELKTKVASFEKKEKAEKLAKVMDEKGLEPELSMSEKVASLLERDDLDVMEKAVGMTATQRMKLASVKDDQLVTVEGGEDTTGDSAADSFAASLASIGD
jgi:hypothetical protein